MVGLSRITRLFGVLSGIAAFVVGGPDLSMAGGKYDPGASDSVIKIGQTTAYSGPFSGWSLTAKVQAAYFNMLNEQGGIGGRKINFISLDDGYSPPKTVEQTRKLVEDDEVLFLFSSLGAASNSAVQKYLNAKKVPQLFVQSGAAKWADPVHFPWTMGWMPSFANEGAIYAKYVLTQFPTARIAIFFQNDDFGKDYVRGFEEGLGAKAAEMIVARASYLPTDPTIDSQIVTLKASGANLLLNASSPKFAAQALRKMHELDWRPTQFLSAPSANINAVFKVAGVEAAIGIISANYLKDPGNSTAGMDAGMASYKEFMSSRVAGVDPSDVNAVWGYASVKTIVQVLKQCGDDLTRENVIRQAASLKDFEVDMLLPGIKINTSATDYEPIQDEQLMKFDGVKWGAIGDIVGK